MSGYNKARVDAVSEHENYKRTLLRLEKIQSYLSTSPRGERLKGKVCIITGAGSLKGIGYEPLSLACIVMLSAELGSLPLSLSFPFLSLSVVIVLSPAVRVLYYMRMNVCLYSFDYFYAASSDTTN
jgi:hypothetical protein